MHTPKQQNTKPQQPARTHGTSAPALPHERDEDTTAQPLDVKPKPAQAAADLSKGQVDTDNYTRVREDNQRNSR